MRKTAVVSRDKKISPTEIPHDTAGWENIDIVASSIIYTYDIDKTHKSILKIP